MADVHDTGPDTGTGTLGRRALIRNAAIVGVAAWTAPVLLDSVTSPAAAASCVQSTLNWNSITAGTGGTTTCSGRNPSTSTTPPCTTTSYTSPSAGGVTITFSTAAFTGTTLLSPGANGGNGNLTVRANPNGGLANQRALQLQMLPNAVGIGQTLTMSFSKSVTNVTFSIYDIDNLIGGWGDRLYFDIAPSSVSFTNASWTPTTSSVTGAGTSANPLRSTIPDNNASDNSSVGNATLTFAGPITTLKLTYYNVNDNQYVGGGNQRIGIGPISYCA